MTFSWLRKRQRRRCQCSPWCFIIFQKIPQTPQMLVVTTSLVKGQDFILDKARKAVKNKIKKFVKDSMIYVIEMEFFSTAPPLQKTTKSNLEKDLINAWRVVHEIDSIFKFWYACSFDLQLFFGTMISLEEWVKGKVKIFMMESLTKINECPKRRVIEKIPQWWWSSITWKILKLHQMWSFPHQLSTNKWKNLSRQQIWNGKLHQSNEAYGWLQISQMQWSSIEWKGEVLKKILAPTTKHTLNSCKCCWNKPCTCQFNCNYNGKQYKFGECPGCHYGCKFLCTELDFMRIEVARTEEKMGIDRKD